jgi:MFS family permease
LNKRIGVGPSIVVTSISFSLGGLGYALTNKALALPVLMFAQALFGFGSVAYNITQVSLRQAITPERLQGRMNASMRFFVWGTIPLGALVGGALASAFDVRTALFVGAGLGFTSTLPILFSPLRTLREFPEQEETPLLHEAGVVTELGGPAAIDA